MFAVWFCSDRKLWHSVSSYQKLVSTLKCLSASSLPLGSSVFLEVVGQEETLISSALLKTNSVASSRWSHCCATNITVVLPRLVCHSGITTFPVSTCLARCSLVKKCCQDAVRCAGSELAVFQRLKSLQILTFFRIFFFLGRGGGRCYSEHSWKT